MIGESSMFPEESHHERLLAPIVMREVMAIKPTPSEIAMSRRIADLEAALEQLRDRVIDEYDRIYINGVLGK